MQVKEIMTENPVCCTPDTNLREVARLMVENDCGCLPVVENAENLKPVGTITDRDICCRTVAEGKNPLEMTAKDCMTSPVVTVSEETSVDDCCRVMEENKVRRVPVVDASGGCCGMVAQADVAKNASGQQIAGMVKEVSRSTSKTSKVEGSGRLY